MRTLFLILFSIVLAFPLQAEHVDRHDAERAAVRWMALLQPSATITEMDAVLRGADTVCYLYNFTPAGFVIVSADDAVLPVLGFSSEGAFRQTEDIPVQEYLAFVSSTVGDVIDRKVQPDSRISAAWEALRNPQVFNKPAKTAAVGPLVSAKWGQDEPFNTACPDLACNRGAGSNNNALTGCVATSLGMIMHYHQHPASGIGTVDGYDFSAATYLWSILPNSINASSPASVKTEVAEIMRHIGAAVGMQYSCQASGAQLPPARDALRYYFKYQTSVQLVYRSDYSTANWDAGLKNEIDNARPMVYAGLDDNIENGHAWVLDGYEVIGGSTYYHMNWGWYGAYNGNYALLDLTPETQNFNNEQQAIVGIIPNLASPRLGISQGTWSAPVAGGDSPDIVVTNSWPGDDTIIEYTVATNDTWLNVAPSTGTTEGNFIITADDNTGGINRSGSVTVEAVTEGVLGSPLTIYVTQSGSGTVGPSLFVTPVNWQAPAVGGQSPSISITNGTEGDGTIIDYTLTTTASWLTLSALSGSTPGTMSLTATANTTGSPRTGTVTVASSTEGVANSPVTISVMQASENSTVDSLVVSPASWIAPVDGGLSPYVSVDVPGQTLAWTATISDTWLSLSTSNTTTPGGFTLSAASNQGGTARTATVTITVNGSTIAGSPYQFTVTQVGSSTGPVLSASAVSWAVSNEGGTSQPIQVSNGNPTSSEDIEYIVTEQLPWLRISQPLGTTPGTFTITADPNSSGANRSGQVQIKAQAAGVLGSPWTITVSQGTAQTSSPKLAVTPRFWTAPAYGGISPEIIVTNASTTDTKSIPYTVSDDAAWITTTSLAGSTTGDFQITAVANTTGATRFAVVRITASMSGVEGSPADIYITQPPSSGDIPQLGITPQTVTASSAGDTGVVVQVFNAAPANSDGFGFDVQDNVSWISFDKLSGDAPQALVMEIDPNNDDTARVARIKITADAGVYQSPQYITVYQSARLAGSFIEVAMRAWNPGPGNVQSPVVNVIGHGATRGIPYRIRTDVAWLSTTWTYGTTPGTFNMITAANNGNTSRTGHVYIADVQGGIQGAEHVITVTQSASTGYPLMDVSLTSWEAPIGGGNSPMVNVTNSNSADESVIAYTAAPDVLWLTISNPSGTTPGQFQMRAQPNTSAGSRSATVTVRSMTPGVLDGVQTISVRQPGFASGLLSCSTASLDSPNYRARPGDKFDITVALSKSIFPPGTGDVELSFLVNFDYSGLYPVKIIGLHGNAWFERVGPGTMRAVISGRSISDGDILRMTMEVLLGNTDVSVWSLADAATSPSVADVGMDESCAGEVQVQPRNGFLTRSDLGIANLVSVYPNPSRKASSPGVSVDVQQPGNVDIRMYTTMGTEAGHIYNGWLAAGEHLLALPSSGLPPGVYMIAMKTADGMKTTRLVITE